MMTYSLIIATLFFATVEITTAEPKMKDPCRKTLDEISYKILSGDLDSAFKRMSPSKPNLKMKEMLKNNKQMRQRVSNSFKNSKYSREVGKIIEYTSSVDGESANIELTLLSDSSCFVTSW